MSNLLVAIDALLALMVRGAQVAKLISTAQAQGRDLTDAELDVIVQENDDARAKLVAAIAARRAGG